MNLSHKEKDLKSLIMDESFLRWISGHGSKIDHEKWEKWLTEHPLNKALYEEALKLWKTGQFRSHHLPDVHTELDKLLNTLNIKHKPEQNASRPNILPMYKRRVWEISAAIISAAAILLVIFNLNISVLHFPFGKKYTTVTTQFGKKAKLILADGSTVILNGNSTLKYPASFTLKTKRKLYLKGEAYFEVTKKPIGPQHNFTVITDEGSITVIGTKFTVYSRDNRTKVALLQGRIKVTAKEKDDNQKISASVIMRPGESLQFTKNEQTLNPENNLNSLQTSWWKERLIFNNTSLKEIITWIKETYGIDAQVNDNKLLQRTITGSVENTNLDLIIETLSKVLQVPVTFKGDKVIFEKSNI